MNSADVPEPTPERPWVCEPKIGVGVRGGGAQVAAELTGIPGAIDPKAIMVDQLKRRTALAVAADLIEHHAAGLVNVMGLTLEDVALVLKAVSDRYASTATQSSPDTPK